MFQKNKIKTRKISIEVKVLFITIFLGIIACVFMGMNLYHKSYSNFVEESRKNVEGLVSVASKQIDNTLLEGLKVGDEETEAYQQIISKLQEFLDGTGMEYAYTLKDCDKDNVQFIVDADTSEDKAMIGELYEKSEAMEEAFQGNVTADKEITQDQWGRYYSAFAPIYNTSGEITAIVGLDCTINTIDEKMQNLKNEIIIISIASFFICVIGGFVLSRHIGKNLKTVNTKISEVVYSDGDLTKLIEVNSGDELELMSNSLNDFLKQLRDIVEKIGASSSSIQLTQTEVEERMQYAAKSILEVASAMQEMNACMQETNAAAEEINQATVESGEAAHTIYADALSGANKAEKISETSSLLKEEAAEAKRTAKQLIQKFQDDVKEKIEQSQSVQKINTLSNDIIGIAKKTNMLALNASIESARAGEAGKGFAVVASQIGELAAASANTASEINHVSAEVIQAVEGLSEQANILIDYVSGNVMKDYDKLLHTGEQYNEDATEFYNIMNGFKEQAVLLENSMKHMKQEISDIVSAIEYSTVNIGNVAQIATELNQDVNKIENITKDNSKMVKDLGDAVGHFKV